MSTRLRILRAGPLTTIQARGRFGMLRHGIAASGPMDRRPFGGAEAAIEFAAPGLELAMEGDVLQVGLAGGHWGVKRDGQPVEWPGTVTLRDGDRLAVKPGDWGNYGYVRFAQELSLEPVLGSQSTNLAAGLGGLEGRALREGDIVVVTNRAAGDLRAGEAMQGEGAIRVMWGLHADRFPQEVRQRFAAVEFRISMNMDRMGVRLTDPEGVFANHAALSLVSDAIVPGDVQILGDGTPVVLMRDHQPTGGYPRIATVVSADLDRFAQMRPGSAVRFAPVSLEHAHAALRDASR